ncbi:MULTISPECIES: thermonuclease family protein [Microbacterium]|uniref:Thermonuclease n=1 Tax=Microbacterium trichothecenolyticum TaxID=69370 RepID=A0A0M2H7X4_MICTR|nr:MULTISPECIES: thermonuclease family protein [Microbacterium]KJL40686.1 Thermonuclease precursor [Microbacterium trichothecenolyticum]MDR7188568.1 micrococcal nuclease [Microbacterium sp. BE35]
MFRRVLIGILLLVIAGTAYWWFIGRDAGADLAQPATGTSATMPAIPADAFEMTVESVHDGDTLRARVAAPNAVVSDLESTRVRLLGIDTPEISPRLDCWGAEATTKLTSLVPVGSTIWVAADVEVHDKYGRTLLYVWTPDGRFVNGELVAQGDARVEVYSPNRSQETLLRSLESAAVAAAAGQWGACG